jgi:addiction module HigA family antidote
LKLTLSIIEEDKGRINENINNRRAITPGIALRLAIFFGVSIDFLINLQLRWDLYKAKHTELKELNRIKPLIQKF